MEALPTGRRMIMRGCRWSHILRGSSTTQQQYRVLCSTARLAVSVSRVMIAMLATNQQQQQWQTTSAASVARKCVASPACYTQLLMHVHVYHVCHRSGEILLRNQCHRCRHFSFTHHHHHPSLSLSLLILHVSNSQPQLGGTASQPPTNLLSTCASVNGDKTRTTSYRPKHFHRSPSD